MAGIGMDKDYEISRIARTAREIAFDLDLDADEIAEWLTVWAIDWDTPDGIAFQIAAAQEFGAIVSEYTRQRIRARGMNASINFSDERDVLRWLYEHKSLDHAITLYRGTDHEEHNGLESWTESREIAEFYVERNGGGSVIKCIFQADEILATWRDGVGLKCACEAIVINR